jgi:hypothetical protein
MRSLLRPLVLAGAILGFSAEQAQADTDPYTDVQDVPTPSLYGGVGLLDMRNARFMPDGYFWIDADIKQPDNRFSLNFQAAPWLETAFRFTVNDAIPPPGQNAYYKYSVDMKFRLFQEGEYMPQVAFGLQDFIGLGLYSAEYLVASKRFGPLDFTTGIGWGRLASLAAFKNPFCGLITSFCTRPTFGNSSGSNGGVPLFNSFLRGQDVGLFGGVEYQTPIPKLTFKVEYSSDAYTVESTTRNSLTGQIRNYAGEPVNVGVQYRFWSNVDLGVAYMYGNWLSVNLDIILNPNEPIWPVRIDPQPSIVPRSEADVQAVQANASVSGTNSSVDESLRQRFVDLAKIPPLDQRPPDPAMASATQAATPAPTPSAQATPADPLPVMRKSIEDQYLYVDGIAIRGDIVKVMIENLQYLRDAEAISRTVRALSASAPPNINVFEITTAYAHVPITTVTVPRSQIDAMGTQTGTPAELWASSILADAPPSTRDGPILGYPRFNWSVFPSVREDLFDPNNPIYIGFGASASSSLEILPGLMLFDQGTYGLWNDFSSITRASNSVLPHVRSDIALYLQKGFTGINNLYLADYFKPAPEIYARMSAGIIEDMFAAVGGEVLYRPYGQRWALGADLYEAFQRNDNELFGFGQYNYHVLTGHATLYVETPWDNTTAVVRFGRYLAGDYGGTFELLKRFDCGVVIGAWFTLTNVPFSEFGEDSFDKGIKIVIPTEWLLPYGTQSSYELDLRPVQRDGGQPLNNDATLYDLTQSSSYGDLQRQWPHVFQ